MKPNQEKLLKVDDNHSVYYAEYGNSNGPAIINIHGGPGSKSKPYHVSRFNTQKYRIIVFDQRGCGKSEYINLLKNNTTQDLIKDIEAIREDLGIEKWYVGGSSWGSTMSLLYAQTHPERTLGLLIASVWLAREEDHEWLFSEKGVAQMMPDLWEYRKNFLKKFNATSNVPTVLLGLLENKSTNLEVKQEIVAGVYSWEGNLFSPFDEVGIINPSDIDEAKINDAQIFLHYEKNNFFVEKNQIIHNIDVIKDIPAIMVSGRYDVLTPLEQAYILNQYMNNSELIIAESSGHKLNVEARTLQYQVFDNFLDKQI